MVLLDMFTCLKKISNFHLVLVVKSTVSSNIIKYLGYTDGQNLFKFDNDTFSKFPNQSVA